MTLAVRNLSFAYPGKQRPETLRDLTFEGRTGEVLFVLGPNGSGKTTLFKCLLGLLPVRRGSITVARHDIRRMSVRQLASLVSYIPQYHANAFNYRARDAVLMGRTPHLGVLSNRFTEHDHLRAEEALAALGMSHLGDKGIAEISGGERQLVLTARAICQDARVLIMDEPTSNLDFGNQVRVLNEIRRLADMGFLVVISSHNPMHAFQYADSVLLLKKGQKIAAGPTQVINEDMLERLYGIPVRIHEIAGEQGHRVCLPHHERHMEGEATA